MPVDADRGGLADGPQKREVYAGCGACPLTRANSLAVALAALPARGIKRPLSHPRARSFPAPQIGSWTWANTGGFVLIYALIGRGRRTQPRLCSLCGWVLYCRQHGLRGTRSRSRCSGYLTPWHGLISVTADNLARFGYLGKHLQTASEPGRDQAGTGAAKVAG